VGYTHYFSYDPSAESFVDAWPQIFTDTWLIACYVQRALGIRLADGDGHGPPEITRRRIRLNGPAVAGLDHETFLIDPTPHPDFEARRFVVGFCKTARKPYDIAVTSILLRCQRLAPTAFVIASDGDWEHDWCPPKQLASGARRPDPASVLELLFAQVETIDNSRLAPNVWNGPPPAHD
jgi:hypothetical protein